MTEQEQTQWLRACRNNPVFVVGEIERLQTHIANSERPILEGNCEKHGPSRFTAAGCPACHLEKQSAFSANGDPNGSR